MGLLKLGELSYAVLLWVPLFDSFIILVLFINFDFLFFFGQQFMKKV